MKPSPIYRLKLPNGIFATVYRLTNKHVKHVRNAVRVKYRSLQGFSFSTKSNYVLKIKLGKEVLYLFFACYSGTRKPTALLKNVKVQPLVDTINRAQFIVYHEEAYEPYTREGRKLKQAILNRLPPTVYALLG